MKKLWILMSLSLLLFVVGAAAAQEEVQAVITVDDTAGLTVGDPITIDINVTHPAGYTVIAPTFEEGWGEAMVVGTETAVIDPTTTRITLDARLFSPGDFLTPPLNISVTDGTGQLASTIAAPAALTVGSVLVEGDSELRDIKPQADLPIPSYLIWLLAGGSILLAAAAYTVWQRRQAKLALAAVDNRAMDVIALDELARVQGLELAENGRFKEHYTLVTDAVREYLEKRYTIPMTERTTAEIQAEMRDSAVSPDMARQIVNFLDDSDLVKFSTFTPDVESARTLLENGRLIIKSTAVKQIEISKVEMNNSPAKYAEMVNC